MNRIDVFVGVVGSGKDYKADKLVAAGTHVRVDFKDALLELASDIVGYDVRADYDWFKEHVVGVRRPANPLIETCYINEWKELSSRFPDLMTGRRLLQRLGTEAMRRRDPDYWAKEWLRRVGRAHASGKDVATGDCRFPNEVVAIRGIGQAAAEFVFCDYRSNRYSPSLPHESEKMAQALLKLGIRDGQGISDEAFRLAFKDMGIAESAGASGCVPPRISL